MRITRAFGLEVPWHEADDLAVWPAAADARQGLGQPGARIEAVHFGCGEQRGDCGPGPATTIGAGRAHYCAFEAPDHAMLVRANDGLIREALTNILDNAINYASANSLITVRLTQQGDQVVLEVEDDGPGMSPDEIAHAGIRFRRGAAGRSREGSGLGLAIAFTAAKVSNGTLSLRRREDRSGLAVTLALPADTDSQLKA